jgi:hypothetical protein
LLERLSSEAPNLLRGFGAADRKRVVPGLKRLTAL